MEIIIWIKAPEPGRSAKEESMQSLADFPDRHSQDWQFMYPEGEGDSNSRQTLYILDRKAESAYWTFSRLYS